MPAPSEIEGTVPRVSQNPSAGLKALFQPNPIPGNRLRS
jgi:hypothetical protein